MVNEGRDRVVDTSRNIQGQDGRHEPHERDEAPDGQGAKPRGIIKQAAEDLAQGLVDTDAHATPGIEQAVDPEPGASGQANPLPERHRDMRDHDATPPADQGKQQ